MYLPPAWEAGLFPSICPGKGSSSQGAHSWELSQCGEGTTSHSTECPCPPFKGLKKLKKDSLGTCLVMVRTVPRPLCFCFFLMVLTVTFFPFFQSIVHLQGQGSCYRHSKRNPTTIQDGNHRPTGLLTPLTCKPRQRTQSSSVWQLTKASLVPSSWSNQCSKTSQLWNDNSILPQWS